MANHPYDDLLAIPYPFPLQQPRMSAESRAAQFAPFSALTGLGAAVQETARLTQPQAELEEDRKALLNQQLQLLLSAQKPPEVTVTYFSPDEKKSGGAYLCVTGQFRKIDPYRQTLLLSGGVQIPIEEIYALDSEVFPVLP